MSSYKERQINGICLRRICAFIHETLLQIVQNIFNQCLAESRIRRSCTRQLYFKSKFHFSDCPIQSQGPAESFYMGWLFEEAYIKWKSCGFGSQSQVGHFNRI